jgi:hypothetical protein
MEFLFGTSVDSLAGVLPYPHNVAHLYPTQSSTAEDFAKAFADAQYVASERAKFGWTWPFFEIFEDKIEKPMKVVNSFL